MILNQWRYRLVPLFISAVIFGLAPAITFAATEKVLNINNWAEYSKGRNWCC